MKTLSAHRGPILACDVMAPNPTSVNETASVREVAAFLLAKRMTAAPVINEAGRAVGVVSLSDIVRHATADAAPQMDGPVRSIMDDEVLFVRPGTTVDSVIDDLLRWPIESVFVADENDVLVGVISASDVLRYINSQADQPASQPPIDAPGRRSSPSLPRRPAPFAATRPATPDFVMAGAR